jgi:hypothetical protein
MADDETPKPPVPTTKAKAYQVEGSGWWGSQPDDLEETVELQWPRGVRVFDQMRVQDAQIRSVLNAVTMPILRTRWFIDPNGADEEVVRHVADDLGLVVRGEEDRPPARRRGRFDFDEHLRLALLKLVFGHAFFEQVYEPVGEGEALRFHLRKLLYIPPRTISRIDVARDGGLVGISQFAATSTTIGEGKTPQLPVAHLVAHVNEREGGNWVGQSLLRSAYKNWRIKDRLLRVQAQTIDRNGMGVPIYTASQVPDAITELKLRTDWAQAEMDNGERLAQLFRSGDRAGGAIPYGATLKLLGVEGDLPDADKPIRYHDEQIARGVLAHVLNLGGGSTTGSYALSDTLAEIFTLSLQTLANGLQSTLQQHVVEDIVDVNYGTDAATPRIMFEEIGARHSVTAEAIRALIESGAIVADDKLDASLRIMYGLPTADPTTARPYKAPGQTAAGGEE